MPVKYATVFGLVAVSIALCSGLAWNVNGGKEVYAINGISMTEYAEMTETLGFDLKDGHQLSADHKAGNETYAVVDASGNKVASVYFIQGTEDIMIPDGHGAQFKMAVYIAISEDGTIYEVAFKKGATGKNWLNGVSSWVENNALGKGQSDVAGADTAGSGATFSSEAFKLAVEEAYKLYAADNA